MFKKARILAYSFLFVYIIYLNQPYSQTEINKDVKPFYIKYMTLVDKQCKIDDYFHPEFKIEFKDLTDGIIGQCSVYPRSFTIHLDNKFWSIADDKNKLQLLSHELFHCMFFQAHVKDRNHFMAEYFVDIPEKKLYLQIEELLKDHCKK